MWWRNALLTVCLLCPAACGSKDGDSPSDRKSPEVQTVRFLIRANGIINTAIRDGRVPAVVFEKQDPSGLTITQLDSGGSEAHGLKPGTYSRYIFPCVIGTRWRFKDAAILVERPLAVEGQFKLSNIKFVGSVLLSGPPGPKGGKNESHGGFDVFDASLDSTWTGNVENSAPDRSKEPPKTK